MYWKLCFLSYRTISKKQPITSSDFSKVADVICSKICIEKVKLPRVFVYELSCCGFDSCCTLSLYVFDQVKIPHTEIRQWKHIFELQTDIIDAGVFHMVLCGADQFWKRKGSELGGHEASRFEYIFLSK